MRERLSRSSALQRLSALIGAAIVVLAAAIDGRAQPSRPVARSPGQAAADAELAKLRAEVLESIKESRARSERLLALYEQERERLTREVAQRRAFYEQGLISRREAAEPEIGLMHVTARAEEVRRWILEDDIAIAEATLRDTLARLPVLPEGGYSENGGLIRFNGLAPWSLKDASKIEKFFFESFGRSLPISAFGQSPSHDRMQFDHREAIDIALHPESAEGRSLIAYLRRMGIPFVAFRSAVPGVATGAHIHIGKPSVRNTRR